MKKQRHEQIWIRRGRCPPCQKTFTVLLYWSPPCAIETAHAAGDTVCKENHKMRKYPVRVRAGLSLVRINLGSAKEYFREANFHFDRQLRDLLAEDQDKPTSYWEEDLGGITRGDLGAERRTKDYLRKPNFHFDRQFRYLLAEDQDKPTSYWEEDLGGITRGDLGAERR